MPDLLLELAKQVPAVLAIVCVVAYFLNHLEISEEARVRMDEKRADDLTILGENCHSFQRSLAAQYAEVGKDMAAALKENARVIGRLESISGKD